MSKGRSLLQAILLTVVCAVVAACGGSGGGGSSSGGGGSSSSSSSAALSITIHYKRVAGDYAGWGLHLWNDATGTPAIATGTATTWTTPHAFDGVAVGWASATISLINANANLNFIVHKGDAKSPMLDLAVNRQSFGADVWVVQDTATTYATQTAADTAAGNVGHQADSLNMAVVTPTATASAMPANWNKRAQFMEIFIRSYKDSDGDGKGDIKGLISKLDYLHSLGVTGLWLMPVYKSQDHDHGYAVTDYRAIEPDYGTMADFDDLITQAHARGIGIVLDYVMNHSAAQNPLFLDAVSSTTNARRNWYIFNATDPGWTGFGGSPSWRISESGYYYGLFSTDMPDFDLTNSAVVAWHMDNLRFWLNKGVDGFRFDAAETFVENGSGAWYNQSQNHAILLQAKTTINAYANRYMVCEAADHPSDYAQPTSCGNAFAFGHQGDMKTSATSGAMTAGLQAYLTDSNRANMPLFLSNHDSFAGDRPIGALGGHAEGDYRIAAALEILGSDTPFALYGEEVGEANNALGDDAGIRAPMNWTADTNNAGFTAGTPYRALSTNLAGHNAASEAGVAGSLLETYRALYAVRSSNPVLASGTLTLLSSSGQSKVVFLRQSGGQTAVVLINLSTSSQNISANTGLPSTSFGTIYPAVAGSVSSNVSGTVTVTVPAQGVVILLAP